MFAVFAGIAHNIMSIGICMHAHMAVPVSLASIAWPQDSITMGYRAGWSHQPPPSGLPDLRGGLRVSSRIAV